MIPFQLQGGVRSPDPYAGFPSFPTKPPQRVTAPGALALPPGSLAQAGGGAAFAETPSQAEPFQSVPFTSFQPSDTTSDGTGGAAALLAGRPKSKTGFSGFLDRFMDPQNTLGQFGRALVMAGGTPLGDAYRYMDHTKRQQTDDALDRQYKQAQIAHLGAGPTPDEFTRTMVAAGIDPRSSEGIRMYRSRAQNQADPVLTQVVHDEDPNTHVITDRIVGVRYSQLGGDGEASPGFGIDPPPAPNTNGVPATGAASLYPSVAQQESGGNYAAVGPQTRYGRAQGGAQMLPDTARGMANKLGLPWRPEMMTGTSPEAVAYQDKLAQAYLSEGLAATGNERDALRYYHGGPDRSKWGPKTNGYADNVLRRSGMGGPVRVSSKAELDELPSGTEYISPDGKRWRKR